MEDIDLALELAKRPTEKIIQISRRAQEIASMREMDDFEVGQEVEFTARGGETLKGRVIRKNRKTVSIQQEGSFQKWSVHPSFLRSTS